MQQTDRSLQSFFRSMIGSIFVFCFIVLTASFNHLCTPADMVMASFMRGVNAEFALPCRRSVRCDTPLTRQASFQLSFSQSPCRELEPEPEPVPFVSSNPLPLPGIGGIASLLLSYGTLSSRWATPLLGAFLAGYVDKTVLVTQLHPLWIWNVWLRFQI